MEMRQLHVFVTVAEEGHFGRAAARLHVVQPAVSQQIQRLERELGAVLFERSSRGARLTAAGEVMLAEARQLLADEVQARRAVRRAAQGEIGQIRVGCVPSALSGVLPKVVPAFRAAHPEVGIFIRELHTAQQFDALVDGRIEAGFLRATHPVAGVAMKPVMTEPLLAALPTEHPLASRHRLPLTALAGEPFVLFARALAPEYFDQLTELCHAAGFTPDVTHEVRSDLAQLCLVASGLGVALVSESTTRLELADVTYVRLSDPNAEVTMAVAYTPSRSLLLRDQLLDVVMDVFQVREG
jgi:DNA-binding transcriptional LysR family regulator